MKKSYCHYRLVYTSKSITEPEEDGDLNPVMSGLEHVLNNIFLLFQIYFNPFLFLVKVPRQSLIHLLVFNLKELELFAR